jgi:hypothetical protein
MMILCGACGEYTSESTGSPRETPGHSQGRVELLVRSGRDIG